MDYLDGDTTTDAPAMPPQKRRTLVSPWRDAHEFEQVYEGIYGVSANTSTRQQALSQMRVWTLRRSVLCPAAVLATRVLLEVQLKDAEEQRHTPKDMQTMYASGFLRFFNFMSSIMQTHNMRTMYETARQLGLQSFIVDLRHVCAHGQALPPLEILRSAAAYCMRWLKEYYWCHQLGHMSAVDASKIRRKDKTAFDESVTQLFGIYDGALECHLKGAVNMKTAKRHLHGKRYAALKAYCEQHKLTQLKAVFAVLMKELAGLVKRATNIKDVNEIYVEGLIKMRYFFVVAEAPKSREQLEALIAATQSLFRMLAVYGFIEDFFHALLQLAENPIAETTRRAGASFWAQQIVQGFVAFRRCKQMYKAELDGNPNSPAFDFSSLNTNGISKQLRKLLIYAGVDLHCTLIFGHTLRRPWIWVFERRFIEQHLLALNEHTAPLLKLLLPLVEPALSDSQMYTFDALIDAYCSSRAAEEEASAKLYTADDLLARLQAQDSDASMATSVTANGVAEHMETTETVQYGLWSTLPDDAVHNWSICALGRVPWN